MQSNMHFVNLILIACKLYSYIKQAIFIHHPYLLVLQKDVTQIPVNEWLMLILIVYDIFSIFLQEEHQRDI